MAKNKKKTQVPAANDDSKPRLTPIEARTANFRIAAQRETVEAIVVAFVLALLFRAFLAEAFVIPTGSMAPTLMGAHKDIFCEHCDYNFRVGASREQSAPKTIVAGICPNCRRVNSMDLANQPNHQTFNGDRILVNKFSYVLADPERWDVIVFKFPGNPKQNYIKRLVGLPNETLSIRHGDVYARKTGTEDRPDILRKPPSTLLAMSQLVYDTDFQSQALVDAQYPSRWQPWETGASSPPDESWKITRGNESGFEATVDASKGQKWLRYFHHFPDDQQWENAISGTSLADVDPYQSVAITDFYPYDSYVHVPSSLVYTGGTYDERGDRVQPRQSRISSVFSSLKKVVSGSDQREFTSTYQSGQSPYQFGRDAQWGGQDSGRMQLGRDGMHWVGDLIFRADINTDTATKDLLLELVEAGERYQCRFDLQTGTATLSILNADSKSLAFDSQTDSSDANLHPTAATPVRAGNQHEIRISNCDDQIVLWVDGNVIEFDAPTTFDARTFHPVSENHPHYLPEHPFDAAPVGIAVSGGKATINGLEVRRDKYYIATKSTNSANRIVDYDERLFGRNVHESRMIQSIRNTFASPATWNDYKGWNARREVVFELAEDQFFPMGDNSPESLDARCWAKGKPSRDQLLPGEVNRDAWKWSDVSYVPRDMLVGRAVLVFWPHSWNEPVPFTPNLKRIKLIR